MKHGQTGTPLHRAWRAMIARCECRTAGNFHLYGGRGIKVCERWRRDFVAFATDMGPKPSGTSLDRLDPNGDYEPGNCRWATVRQQHDNRRVTRTLFFRGQKKTLRAWAIERGISYFTLRMRIDHGWPVERALTLPPRRYSRGLETAL